MNFHSACAPKAQRFPAQKPPRQTFSPRPHQTEAAACLNNAIWDAEGRPLFVAPVSAGKTLILVMVAKTALERGCKRVIVVSRSKHVVGQSLETLRRYAPGILGGLYTGSKKQTACQILFSTAPTLARHLNIVEAADLILVDEASRLICATRPKNTRPSSALRGAMPVSRARRLFCKRAGPFRSSAPARLSTNRAGSSPKMSCAIWGIFILSNLLQSHLHAD